MAQERVAVLTRHLVSAPVATELPEFDPGEVYLFLTRDNVELRARMLDHLKVRHRRDAGAREDDPCVPQAKHQFVE